MVPLIRLLRSMQLSRDRSTEYARETMPHTLSSEATEEYAGQTQLAENHALLGYAARHPVPRACVLRLLLVLGDRCLDEAAGGSGESFSPRERSTRREDPRKEQKYTTTGEHPHERRMCMFWGIIDGFLDGDWRPLTFVLLLVITLLAVGWMM
jgi:hypothetical protein